MIQAQIQALYAEIARIQKEEAEKKAAEAASKTTSQQTENKDKKGGIDIYV